MTVRTAALGVALAAAVAAGGLTACGVGQRPSLGDPEPGSSSPTGSAKRSPAKTPARSRSSVPGTVPALRAPQLPDGTTGGALPVDVRLPVGSSPRSSSPRGSSPGSTSAPRPTSAAPAPGPSPTSAVSSPSSPASSSSSVPQNPLQSMLSRLVSPSR